MNRLPKEKRAQILGMLVQGNSLRSVSLMADVSINTVTKLLVDLGTTCSDYQDRALRNLKCRRLQCDEIWSFIGMKSKTAGRKEWTAVGDIWTWTAMDEGTKLVPSWLVGSRDSGTAHDFVQDLADRMENRIQLTTDGHKVYLEAIELAFGASIDYSMLEQLYGADERHGEARFSPPVCIGTHPDPAHVSTTLVERPNFMMRMSTRLTNVFSRKAANHAHAVAIHLMFHNFGRIHRSLRVTPAMAAGVADHVWSLEEIVKLAK